MGSSPICFETGVWVGQLIFEEVFDSEGPRESLKIIQ